MRAVLLGVMLFVSASNAAASTEVEDRVYKFACSEASQAQDIVPDIDFLVNLCAESAEPDPHVRVYVCGGSIVSAMVGPAEALAAFNPCDIKPPPPPTVIEWRCARGLSFTAQIYAASAAFIKAGGENYFLIRPPTVREGLYERRGVVFEQVGASARLTGAAGGPYERCVA